MIEAQNLKKQFKNVVAVNGVSFSASVGEVVGFLGANGAGKSTTMRLLTGFLELDSGNIRIFGNDMGKQCLKAQILIGYLPESASGFPHLTVYEFLKFVGEARGLRDTILESAIQNVSANIELLPAINKPLADLSKGWRQRAWLAQALIHDPPILILDEPTDGLDPLQKNTVRRLIKRIAAEKIIIISSHILEEAEEVCDRIIIINDGRIVVDKPKDQLIDKEGNLAPMFEQLVKNAQPDQINSS
ncbi:MAG: hypothetical protein CBB68_04370 [Rhodospirillaceae bacterium TMED8]|nr:multidrug ABC transporter ATP-binding protein [Magnetovibrio sp.]OUT51569.1 MAG: hypothetical protein CBB68_04370 [Rhodospirillaceae bacterium TMED8]